MLSAVGERGPGLDFTFSTMADKRDQPDLLRTINLAGTLHSGTAAPLDINIIGVVRLMM